MDARYLIAGMLLSSLAGCQSGGNTELMERELRLQEDRIYYLEDELARCCEAMQCSQADARGGQGPAASKAPARRTTSAPPADVPADTLPKVELELPTGPAPVNSFPSLFEPASPASDDSPGTAMRIVRPAKPVADSTDSSPTEVAVTREASDPPRMRFASALEERSQAGPSRVVMQWSAAPGDREPAETSSPAPRTAVSSGILPRRPQWSPYR